MWGHLALAALLLATGGGFGYDIGLRRGRLEHNQCHQAEEAIVARHLEQQAAAAREEGP